MPRYAFHKHYSRGESLLGFSAVRYRFITYLEALSQVHRSILAQDGSMFESMFSLPDAHIQVSTTNKELTVVEGDSDDSPIYLQGDSVDEFRDLLWSLYALPHEIRMIMSPLAASDVVKLVNVARMAHKYHFANVEAWALRTLECQTDDSVPIDTHSLTLATEVAIVCDNAKLLQLVCAKWRNLIRNNEDLSAAITVLGRLGIHDLNGQAYYAMMIQGREKWTSDPLLTREHRIRLLSGYHTISYICDNLPLTPPNFPHHASCYDIDACGSAWKARWKYMSSPNLNSIFQALVSTLDKTDFIGKMNRWLGAFKALLGIEVNGLPPGWTNSKLNSNCVPLALQAMTDRLASFEAQLADIFKDVE